MRKIHEYTVIIEQDESGYYVAEVPEIKSCYTQAKSLDELMKRIREVMQLCLEEESPRPKGTRFIGVQRVSM